MKAKRDLEELLGWCDICEKCSDRRVVKVNSEGYSLYVCDKHYDHELDAMINVLLQKKRRKND